MAFALLLTGGDVLASPTPTPTQNNQDNRHNKQPSDRVRKEVDATRPSHSKEKQSVGSSDWVQKEVDAAKGMIQVKAYQELPEEVRKELDAMRAMMKPPPTPERLEQIRKEIRASDPKHEMPDILVETLVSAQAQIEREPPGDKPHKHKYWQQDLPNGGWMIWGWKEIDGIPMQVPLFSYSPPQGPRS